MTMKKSVNILTCLVCIINLFYLVFLDFYNHFDLLSNTYSFLYILGPFFINGAILYEKYYSRNWKILLMIMGVYSHFLLLFTLFISGFIQYVLFSIFALGALLCIFAELKYTDILFSKTEKK